MSFDTRYSLAQLMGSQSDRGIQVDQMGRFSREKAQEIERNNLPWLNSYTGVMGGVNGEECPDMWTVGDSFLRINLGTKVRYDEKRVYPSGENQITKTIGRYSAPLVQSLLKKHNDTLLSEQFLMEDVDIVEDSLDLRGTEIKSLPKLRTVGRNLTLDAHSQLEKMPSLKTIEGKLTVVAKNKEEMDSYLKKLQIIDENGKPKVNIKGNIEFVMKSYI